jgi:hypothetical protein
MSLKSRFESRDALIEGLRAQKIIQGDVEVATGIAEVGELVEFAPGQNLIVQGAADRDMYFILAGKASVIVKGSRLYPIRATERAIQRAGGLNCFTKRVDGTSIWDGPYNNLACGPHFRTNINMDV